MKVEHLQKRYGTLTVLQDLSLQLPDRGVTCLFGPSGCGKTTLLRLLTGLERPDGGVIRVPFVRPAYVFQEDRLLGHLSAAQNIAVACRKDPMPYLAQVGLADFAHTRCSELSGGMARRVALARALAFDGDAFVLDEPFKGLDEENRARTMALFAVRAKDVPVLYITHDRAEALAFAHTVLYVQGPPLTLQRTEVLRPLP